MAQYQDIDYLYASARVRALENSLLNRDRLRKMAEAPTDDEALKVLSECGYGDDIKDLAKALNAKQAYTFSELEKVLPDKSLIGLFRLKYDYHNIKALIKGKAKGEEFSHLLLNTGTVDAAIIEKVAEESAFDLLPAALRDAAKKAEEMLARTQDPRLADTVLDQAMYQQMSDIAAKSGIKLLKEYVRLAIDSANLRMAVRLKHSGQDFSRLADFYINGGITPLAMLKVDITPEALESLYKDGHALAQAAQAGAKALRGQIGLAEMDRLADDALISHWQQAKYVGFGVEPVMAFLAATELESTAVFTLMAGRKIGDQPQSIMERLRKTYV